VKGAIWMSERLPRWPSLSGRLPKFAVQTLIERGERPYPT